MQRRLGWVLGAGFAVACGSGNTDDGTSDAIVDASATAADGPSQAACVQDPTELDMLATCTAADTATLDVHAGCEPTVDGHLHAAEWDDATCFTVDGGDMTATIKYAGDFLYLATSGQPTCGCGMPFAFDPDGSGASDDDEFALSVFDDPFNVNGDRVEFRLTGGTWAAGAAPAGIDVLCPEPQATPIRYEWKIPLATLGISPGQPHTFRLAVIHADAHWPTGLAVDAGFSTDVTTWGELSSSSDWQ